MTAVDISPAKDGGVLKQILKEGISDSKVPLVGSKVKVHYIGTLLDGTKFDSSRDRGKPFSFKLGMSKVIKGWDIGVATMKKGEIALLTCAPEYAYGDTSCGKIPPGATLQFEIEMIDWIGEDLSPRGESGIERFQIKRGKGAAKPQEQSLVNIHLTGKYNDQIFEDRDVQFYLGEGEDVGVIEGVEIALSSFKKGEQSKLKIKSKYAFKKEGKPEFNIPPNADVEYIVTLINFEKSIDHWSLDEAQHIEQAKIFKEKGTNYYKAEKYNLAIKMYKNVLNFLKFQKNPLNTLYEETKPLVLSAHLNLASCYLKTGQYAKVKEECSKALELDPKNEKAYYRRGQAYLSVATPEMAIKDFEEVLRIEPKNVAATKQIIICNNHIKKHLQKEKKLYANMFDKFAREDKQKEEEKRRQQPDVMRGALGEWGQEERPGGRDATAFERENPNILMLNANGTGEFQNM